MPQAAPPYPPPPGYPQQLYSMPQYPVYTQYQQPYQGGAQGRPLPLTGVPAMAPAGSLAPTHPGNAFAGRGRNPRTSLVLSLLIPGLGQLYNRDSGKGLFLLSLSLYLIGLAALWLVTHFITYRYGVILLFPLVIVWLYGTWDAYAHVKASTLVPATPPAA